MGDDMTKNKETDIPRVFTTRAQALERGQVGRRLGYSVLGALLLLALGIWLSPEAEEEAIPFRHYGVQDELRIMPDLSIDDGRETRHQLPKSLQAPPPPSRLEVEREPESENATEPRPPEPTERQEEILDDTPLPQPDAETAEQDQVEMLLPQQSNPDFFILKHVPAQYPLNASEEDRRIPLIFVKASMFVGPDGKVSDVLVEATNGGQAFVDEVMRKLKMMEFGWRVDPGPGRWINTTFNFRSPYFQPESR